ncbi:MAG: site-specific DNA-methyltransferase [Chloroflexi bacterium]|nr:site-specific DNA-methyltransferase [Chloroflexota bacterium]
MDLAEVVELLGVPYYQHSQCLIYQGDCLDYMRRMPNEIIDLTVTSPPYNIGKAYEDTRPLDEYLAWCEDWIQEVHRLSTASGSFWLNLGYLAISDRAKAIPIPYLLWQRIPFFLIQEIVWQYGAGVAGRKFFSPRNEKFLWYVKNPEQYTFNLDDVRDPDVKYPHQKKNGKIKVNPIGKNPGDVWQFKKVTSGQNRASKERTPHPAQFPEEVIERIILASSNEGDLIFDPFIGSGTTAAVALRLQRRVIGFEIQPDYCAITAARLKNVIHQAHAPHQPVLFAEG